MSRLHFGDHLLTTNSDGDLVIRDKETGNQTEIVAGEIQIDTENIATGAITENELSNNIDLGGGGGSGGGSISISDSNVDKDVVTNIDLEPHTEIIKYGNPTEDYTQAPEFLILRNGEIIYDPENDSVLSTLSDSTINSVTPPTPIHNRTIYINTKEQRTDDNGNTYTVPVLVAQEINDDGTRNELWRKDNHFALYADGEKVIANVSNPNTRAVVELDPQNGESQKALIQDIIADSIRHDATTGTTYFKNPNNSVFTFIKDGQVIKSTANSQSPDKYDNINPVISENKAHYVKFPSRNSSLPTPSIQTLDFKTGTETALIGLKGKFRTLKHYDNLLYTHSTKNVFIIDTNNIGSQSAKRAKITFDELADTENIKDIVPYKTVNEFLYLLTLTNEGIYCHEIDVDNLTFTENLITDENTSNESSNESLTAEWGKQDTNVRGVTVNNQNVYIHRTTGSDPTTTESEVINITDGSAVTTISHNSLIDSTTVEPLPVNNPTQEYRHRTLTFSKNGFYNDAQTASRGDGTYQRPKIGNNIDPNSIRIRSDNGITENTIREEVVSGDGIALEKRDPPSPPKAEKLYVGTTGGGTVEDGDGNTETTTNGTTFNTTTTSSGDVIGISQTNYRSGYTKSEQLGGEPTDQASPIGPNGEELEYAIPTTAPTSSSIYTTEIYQQRTKRKIKTVSDGGFPTDRIGVLRSFNPDEFNVTNPNWTYESSGIINPSFESVLNIRYISHHPAIKNGNLHFTEQTNTGWKFTSLDSESGSVQQEINLRKVIAYNSPFDSFYIEHAGPAYSASSNTQRIAIPVVVNTYDRRMLAVLFYDAEEGGFYRESANQQIGQDDYVSPPTIKEQYIERSGEGGTVKGWSTTCTFIATNKKRESIEMHKLSADPPSAYREYPAELADGGFKEPIEEEPEPDIPIPTTSKSINGTSDINPIGDFDPQVLDLPRMEKRTTPLITKPVQNSLSDRKVFFTYLDWNSDTDAPIRKLAYADGRSPPPMTDGGTQQLAVHTFPEGELTQAGTTENRTDIYETAFGVATTDGSTSTYTKFDPTNEDPISTKDYTDEVITTQTLTKNNKTTEEGGEGDDSSGRLQETEQEPLLKIQNTQTSGVSIETVKSLSSEYQITPEQPKGKQTEITAINPLQIRLAGNQRTGERKPVLRIDENDLKAGSAETLTERRFDPRQAESTDPTDLDASSLSMSTEINYDDQGDYVSPELNLFFTDKEQKSLARISIEPDQTDDLNSLTDASIKTGWTTNDQRIENIDVVTYRTNGEWAVEPTIYYPNPVQLQFIAKRQNGDRENVTSEVEVAQTSNCDFSRTTTRSGDFAQGEIITINATPSAFSGKATTAHIDFYGVVEGIELQEDITFNVIPNFGSLDIQSERASYLQENRDYHEFLWGDQIHEFQIYPITQDGTLENSEVNLLNISSSSLDVIQGNPDFTDLNTDAFYKVNSWIGDTNDIEIVAVLPSGDITKRVRVVGVNFNSIEVPELETGDSNNPTIPLGDDLDLTALSKDHNINFDEWSAGRLTNKQYDITERVSVSSSDDTIISVDGNTITAQGTGTATLTFTHTVPYDGATDEPTTTYDVDVTAAEFDRIELQLGNNQVDPGGDTATTTATVYEVTTDGSQTDVTADATISSPDTNVAEWDDTNSELIVKQRSEIDIEASHTRTEDGNDVTYTTTTTLNEQYVTGLSGATLSPVNAPKNTYGDKTDDDLTTLVTDRVTELTPKYSISRDNLDNAINVTIDANRNYGGTTQLSPSDLTVTFDTDNLIEYDSGTIKSVSGGGTGTVTATFDYDGNTLQKTFTVKEIQMSNFTGYIGKAPNWDGSSDVGEIAYNTTVYDAYWGTEDRIIPGVKVEFNFGGPFTILDRDKDGLGETTVTTNDILTGITQDRVFKATKTGAAELTINLDWSSNDDQVTFTQSTTKQITVNEPITWVEVVYSNRNPSPGDTIDVNSVIVHYADGSTNEVTADAMILTDNTPLDFTASTSPPTLTYDGSASAEDDIKVTVDVPGTEADFTSILRPTVARGDFNGITANVETLNEISNRRSEVTVTVDTANENRDIPLTGKGDDQLVVQPAQYPNDPPVNLDKTQVNNNDFTYASYQNTGTRDIDLYYNYGDIAYFNQTVTLTANGKADAPAINSLTLETDTTNLGTDNDGNPTYTPRHPDIPYAVKIEFGDGSTEPIYGHKSLVDWPKNITTGTGAWGTYTFEADVPRPEIKTTTNNATISISGGQRGILQETMGGVLETITFTATLDHDNGTVQSEANISYAPQMQLVALEWMAEDEDVLQQGNDYEVRPIYKLLNVSETIRDPSAISDYPAQIQLEQTSGDGGVTINGKTITTDTAGTVQLKATLVYDGNPNETDPTFSKPILIQ